jgi:hypothetical protein
MNLGDDLDESGSKLLLGGARARSSKGRSDSNLRFGRPTNAARTALRHAWDESRARILDIGYGLGWTDDAKILRVAGFGNPFLSVGRETNAWCAFMAQYEGSPDNPSKCPFLVLILAECNLMKFSSRRTSRPIQ